LTSTTPDIHPRAAWQHRDFRLFQTARVNAVVASQMTAVAVGAQLWDMTHNPLDLGFLGLSLFLPMFGLSLFTGMVADHFDRRMVITVCQIGILLSAFLLLVLALVGVQSPWPIFAVLLLQGSARAFLGPASQSLLPLLIPREHLPNAIVWSTTVFQFGTIVGPSLGGVGLFLSTRDGHEHPEIVYAAATVLMLVAMTAIRKISIRTGQLEKSGISIETVFAGLTFILKRRIVLGAMSLDLFAVLLAGATALLPVFAKDILLVGGWGLGILRGSMGVGAALTAVGMAYMPPLKAPGKMMFWCVAGFGLGTIVFGLSTNFVLSVAALVLMGAFDMISVVVRQTLVQTMTPREMLGRVNAVNLIFIGASNELGEFESGVTAKWFGVVPAVVIGGIGSILITAIWAALFPELRKYDGKHDPEQEKAK
jgi:MFS family permease